jgi:hypothetical protein
MSGTLLNNSIHKSAPKTVDQLDRPGETQFLHKFQGTITIEYNIGRGKESDRARRTEITNM